MVPQVLAKLKLWSRASRTKAEREADALRSATLESTPLFVPSFTTCKVVKVYDGDTVHVAALTGGSDRPSRFVVRLPGIDAPEIRSRDPMEKKTARYVQEELSKILLGRIVKARVSGTDKYGRLLADLIIEDPSGAAGTISVSAWLLDKGYATEYDGGKKSTNDWWRDVNDAGFTF